MPAKYYQSHWLNRIAEVIVLLIFLFKHNLIFLFKHNLSNISKTILNEEVLAQPELKAGPAQNFEI